MITAIDPTQVKASGKTVKASSASQDFSVFMGSMAPAGGEINQLGASQNGAAVTEAAMTGLSGAGSTAAGPYFYGPGTPTAGIATFSPDDALPAVGGGNYAPTTGTQVSTATGLPFQNPSQDFVEKDYLLRQMNDSAMNMLLLQSRVQDDNRRLTLLSGIVQARHNTLREMIQHIGRT